MVIHLSIMSFDPLSLPNNNNNSTLSQLQMNNTQPNSLKRVSSPQFQYKYSKNKHLSQQIHKKKKNRNKQKHHKKKKLIKIKQNKALNKPPNRRKPKLKKTQLLTPLINQNDDIDYTYIKKHNEMNHKHKKIQVINNNEPHYYFDTTKISNKNLNNYNYNSNSNKSKLSIPMPTLPTLPTIPNNKPIHKPNILWLASPQILKCSPSPMANTLLNQSPLMLNQIATNKGEVLMGFETKFQLSDGMISQKSNCQLSVISDYKYEGVQNVNYNINNCLNTLKSINLYKNNYTSKEISINTLNEMELIIKQLKNKIINVNDNEHKYDNNICLSTDNDATDSSFLRSHISNINTTCTETDDEHENEDEEYDNDSNKSMILGVKFMENTTADGDNDNVVYYD
eukprot:484142_1